MWKKFHLSRNRHGDPAGQTCIAIAGPTWRDGLSNQDHDSRPDWEAYCWCCPGSVGKFPNIPIPVGRVGRHCDISLKHKGTNKTARCGE